MEKSAPNVFINAMLDNVLESDVTKDILKAHARESISLLNFGNLSITRANQKLVEQVQFTEAEISPFHKNSIDCETVSLKPHERKPSLNAFSPEKIDFFDVKKLLLQSFSADENGRRPYASAGGLYPVEPLVFLFPERLTGFSSHKPGCYHFRAITKKLQLIKAMEHVFFYDQLLHGILGENETPAFCVLYTAVMSKATFKYRYRGYRHAVMEAGSMYQKATDVSDQMGLRTTVWSGFSEQQLIYALNLDHSVYLPLTMQFFGYGE